MKHSSNNHNSKKLDSQNMDNDEIDQSLMAKVKTGDIKAFEQLMQRHQQSVFGTVSKMLNHSPEAEDIAQQVFIRLWKNAKKYQAKAKFTTYLYTIARNLVFNETKRKKRKPTVSSDEKSEDSHYEAADKEIYQPDNSTLHAELNKAVDDAIASLPEIQRMAMILRRYEHMNYEDIATTLDLSVSAVKSHLFRARTTLKERLTRYLE